VGKERKTSKNNKTFNKIIQTLGHLTNNLLRKVGLEIIPSSNSDSIRRMKIIRHYDINTLFDIGANAGQYGKSIREMGYKGKIISFEPLNDAFDELEKISSKDKKWIVNNYALGNEDTKSFINVSENSFSSSILNMLPRHLESAPTSEYLGQQEINIKKIDSIFNSFCNKDDNIMIKIDTQGYEKNVIDGASKSLSNIKIIQLEMSILPLYQNEMLFVEMIHYLDKRGFQLFSLETGFSDPSTGQLLQVDGIFTKKSSELSV
jgi:FkbM family methyltransferase